MADKFTAPLGAEDGKDFATDEIGTLNYPISKLAFGALNTAVLASAGAGVVDTGCLRVTLASDENVTVDGTVTVTHPALGGGVEAGAQRVTIANDSTGQVTIDGTVTANAGTGTMTVDGSGVTQPVSGTVNLGTIGGTATETTLSTLNGKVTACDTGAVVVSSGTVTNLSQLGGVPVAMNTGVRAAGVQRVTIATNDVINAAQTGTWNVNNVSGTVSLPTGAATAANQLADGHNVTVDNAIGAGVYVRPGTGVNLDTSAVTVSAALPAGTNNIGDVDVATLPSVTIGTWSAGTMTVDLGANNDVRVVSDAAGGATPGKVVSTASTNATSLKASAGTLYSLTAFNLNASPRYVKFYNKASAPTVGTDVPVQVFMIPGDTTGAGFVVPLPACGIAFSTGIAYALTTGIADTDTAAVASQEIVMSYSYK